MKTKQLFVVLGALLLLFIVSPVVRAADELSPEARESFDKGLVAVNQQEWQIAIRYFLKAQEKAPYAPEVLFNLGLAESKVAGRELRSLAWFRAYLEKAQNAANADAVRKEIAGLEIRIEAAIGRLIEQAMQLAEQEDEKTGWRGSHLVDIAVAQALSGDIPVAKRTAAKAKHPNRSFENEALSKIAVIQYHSGDITGAENTIREIGPDIGGAYSNQSLAYGYIARLQAIEGDFSKAKVNIEKEKWDLIKPDSYWTLACEEALAGKRSQALEHIAKALQITMSLDKDSRGQAIEFYRVGRMQVFLGDIDGAKNSYLLGNKETREHTNLEPEPFDQRYFEGMQIEKEVAGLRKNGSWFFSLEWLGDPRLFEVKPNISVPSEKYIEWTRLLQNKLSDELFTDQQGALRTIAGKGTPDEIVSGMVKAIDKIIYIFNEIKIRSH
jgi:hypothetical protein